MIENMIFVNMQNVSVMSRYIVKGVPFRTKGAVNVEDCTTSEEVIKKLV